MMPDMKPTPLPRSCVVRARQRGYSLIELSIAMVLAVFLLAGLFTIFQGTRHTSTEQTGLAQLQDNERLAMTIITDVVQEAGYFPAPATNSQSAALPLDGSRFQTPGQGVSGSTNNGTQGDNLVVRFATFQGDGVLNCVGGSNTANGNGSSNQGYVFTQTFQVNTTNQLTCQPNTGIAAVPLVNGMVSMTLKFGVNTIGAAGSNCPADTYVPTADMTQTYWTNVCSVLVTLTFINPLYQPAGQPLPTPGQNQNVTFQRVIGIMSKSGTDVVVSVTS
jgi:type IV pilus assembly protein PilW